jgi:hypothetical protein
MINIQYTAILIQSGLKMSAVHASKQLTVQPNNLLFLLCAVIENNSGQGVQQVRCFLDWKQKYRDSETYLFKIF